MLVQLLAPKAPQYLRPVLKYAHQPLVGRLLAEILAHKTPESRAMVQTTAVATMLQAGELPGQVTHWKGHALEGL
jgi:hypothetical protein